MVTPLQLLVIYTKNEITDSCILWAKYFKNRPFLNFNALSSIIIYLITLLIESDLLWLYKEKAASSGL